MIRALIASALFLVTACEATTHRERAIARCQRIAAGPVAQAECWRR
ncbi:hypothetical protein JT366_09390 [Sphingomonas paucimobilis]|nr:hypothetical protein [Sphingomonas paucimobilis]QRY97113.1 hypothetical protein JT366_07720 [Sphingomonas paucimobilis]QRY97280.1 hypothetical protein JT366_08695 [Sphingomonas paucimobilis]QRY97406.1 hypothetical protein JT366_09390 [Sphingomonas paucimobilis]